MSAGTRAAVLGDPGTLSALHRVADVDPDLLLTDFADGSALPAHRLGETEVLLTGWGCPPLDAAALARMPRLRAVVHAAGSVKHHVTEACWERGLLVSSAAAANAVPVAEYTLAAILFANKRVLESAHLYRATRGHIDLLNRYPAIGNYRRTVGLVGASLIGRRVLELLRPFDLRVLVHDPYADPAELEAMGAEAAALDELLSRSDVVSLHAPALPQTHHLLDAPRLALMRDGATLVNTARGSLVDTAALTEELVAGRLHAVLDHTEPEVLPGTSPLFNLPNVLLTPHVAGSLGGELDRLAATAVEELERYALGLGFRYAVDPGRLAYSA
ncbi:hydroxyacid dehydrogenase [Streptomyces sp. NPDC002138]|uniref:hydroxyacid dehydrogenase n=1 Tax=Streptomyces sp. NPDC002138 TaxID=3154410 RepID=UPI003328314D